MTVLPLLTLALSASASDLPVRGPLPVTDVNISVAVLCRGGQYSYAVEDVSPDLGPALSVSTGKSEAGYLYLSEAGYQIHMEGDGTGAKLFLSDPSVGNRLPFAVLDPATPQCRFEGSRGRTYERIRLHSSVRAELEVKPRTGIIRPACYKNVIVGGYVLELWKHLRFALSDREIKVKSADSANFGDKDECRKYHETLKKG